MASSNEVKEQLVKENQLLQQQIKTLVGELEQNKTNPNTKLTDEMIIKSQADAKADDMSEKLEELTVSGEQTSKKQDQQKVAQSKPAPKQVAAKSAKGGQAQADDKPVDISRLDLRIGQIIDVKKHPDADSLYVETIVCGDENPRTVISGLVRHVPIEEMKDRKVVVLCNLKPAKMRGILSEAMVMCASTPDKVELLSTPEQSCPGDRVMCEGYEGEPDSQLNPKKKVWEQVSVDLKTNDDGVAHYKDAPFKIKDKDGLFTSNLKNVPIK